jgi:hypothetical protein
MKKLLTALSLAVLATVSWAGVEVTTNPELACALPASPEIASALDL